MAQIAPAILSATPDEYRLDLERALRLGSRIQIDIEDGQFAPNKTVQLPQLYWPETAVVDLHLMMHRVANDLEQLISMKPNLVIIHAEGEDSQRMSKLDFLRQLKAVGIKTGVAILQPTSVGEVSDMLSSLDHVLVFTGSLGSMGGTMDETALAKIAEIKSQYPNVEVGVDGGITDKNARRVVEAGADLLNVGGYLKNATDPQAAYATLEEIAHG